MFDIAASQPSDVIWWRTTGSPHPGCALLELRVQRGTHVYPCDLTAPPGEPPRWVVCLRGCTFPTSENAQATLLFDGFVHLPRPDVALARMHFLTGAEAQGWLWMQVYHYLRIVRRDWRGTRITTDEATEAADAIAEMFAKKEQTYDQVMSTAPPGAPEPCPRCEPFLSVVMLERDHAHGVEIPAALDQVQAAERERDALLAEAQTLRQEKEERERADTTRAHRVTELVERMTKAEEERDQARKEAKAEWFADRAEQTRMREALRADDPRCELCNKPATCFGRYSGMEASALHCDDCCLHGCEDGHCDLLGVAKVRAEHQEQIRGALDLIRPVLGDDGPSDPPLVSGVSCLLDELRDVEGERDEAQAARDALTQVARAFLGCFDWHAGQLFLHRTGTESEALAAFHVLRDATIAPPADATGQSPSAGQIPLTAGSLLNQRNEARAALVALTEKSAPYIALVQDLAGLHPPVAHNPWTTEARRQIERARTLIGWEPAQESYDVVVGLGTLGTTPAPSWERARVAWEALRDGPWQSLAKERAAKHLPFLGELRNPLHEAEVAIYRGNRGWCDAVKDAHAAIGRAEQAAKDAGLWWEDRGAAIQLTVPPPVHTALALALLALRAATPSDAEGQP